MSLLAVGCMAALACQDMSRAPLHHTISGSEPVGSYPKGPGAVVLWLEATHKLARWQPLVAPSRSPGFRAGESLGFPHLPTMSVCCFLKGTRVQC